MPAPKPTSPPPDPTLDAALRWGPLIGLALVTGLAMAMYGHVFGGEIAGDDLTFHLAESTRMRDCIRAGDWDLWNPSANAGYASAYYYQAIPQLVPAVFAAITNTDVLPWFQLCVFLPLVLAPAAAYRAMRLLGTPSWHALGAGFAILMCASNSRWGFGADGTFSVGLYTQTWALAAFPLALAHGIRWIRDGAGLGPALAWGLFAGVCHPFAGVAIGVALVAAAGAIAVTSRLRRRPRTTPVFDALRGRPYLRWLPRLTSGYTELVRATGATRDPPLRIGAASLRINAIGLLLVLGAASAWLPVIVDYAGFGGFPHRVADEIGPGFKALADWYVKGNILDCAGAGGRMRVMTLLFPLALVFGRDRTLPWMWWGAAAFAFLLGLGPHLPTTGGDDLFPMVRFIGPMQVCLALGIGVGAVSLGTALWRLSTRLPEVWLLPAQAAIAAAATAAAVAIAIPGVRIAHIRVQVSTDYEHIHRDQLREIGRAMAAHPPGRHQARDGMANHWAIQLPYVDARVPALLQMGGAGLQSSPNYDFVWTEHDPARIAWVFDAPYVSFTTENADKLPEGDTVIETADFTVRALPAPGLVSPVEVARHPLPPGRFAARKAGITWLQGPDALADKLIAYTGYPGLASPPAGKVLDARHQESPGDTPDIVATVHADRPTTFVVRESWHPRWRGFVDGKAVALRRVTPDFFAVDVPAGDHALGFRFDRPLWVWLTWLLLVLVPAAGWWLGRRLGRIGVRDHGLASAAAAGAGAASPGSAAD